MVERRLWRIQTRINTRRLFEITGPVIDRRLPVRIREALRRLGKRRDGIAAVPADRVSRPAR